MSDKSLYERLGGYDAFVAVATALDPKLMTDPKLNRFWLHRGKDGLEREAQLLIDFLCNKTGGPVYYTGRDMKLTHEGMNIDKEDYDRLAGYLTEILTDFNVGQAEIDEFMNLINSYRDDIIEA